ncbi:MAG TPA: Rrf2 family transcriptional regulator [Rubrivivax sp.]|nr:Rrf2 family transcriptional regulator [Rubrivivax sp.]
MKLTTFTDYSLRTLMYLAAEPPRRATIAQIADAFGISENHLTKVAHHLGRHGWLANVRGKGGGLQLALAPAQIGVGAVVRLTEGGDGPAACFGAEPSDCAIGAVCRLRGVLDEALRAFYAVLDRYTVADLARDPQALARLLPPLARTLPAARGALR